MSAAQLLARLSSSVAAPIAFGVEAVMRLWLGTPVVPPEHWSTSAVVFDGFNYGGELPIIPGLLVAAPAAAFSACYVL